MTGAQWVEVAKIVAVAAVLIALFVGLAWGRDVEGTNFNERLARETEAMQDASARIAEARARELEAQVRLAELGREPQL